jgi:hypothetical protein
MDRQASNRANIVYLRRSSSPKKDETTMLSTQHEHYSSLEFPTRVNMPNISMRGFRRHLEVDLHLENGF